VPAIGADTAVVAATGLPPCTHPFYNSTGIRATPDATWVDVNSSGELKFENRRTSQGLNSCTWLASLFTFRLANQVYYRHIYVYALGHSCNNLQVVIAIKSIPKSLCLQ
jgi:hypothetical protein